MLYTIIFYNLIILLSSTLLYVSEHEKTKIGRNICIFLAFLITVIPSAIRFEIGSDYVPYKEYFERLTYGTEVDIEPGFLLIYKTIVALGLGYEWFFAIVALLIHTFAFLSYPKKNRFLSHLIFMLLFYLASMNIMRQMLAVTIVMYALSRYLNNKQLLKYVLTVLLASSFHTVSLLFLFIPFFNNKLTLNGLKNFSWVTLLLWLAIFLGGATLIAIMELLINQLDFFDYAGYLESERYGVNTSSLNYINIFIRSLFYLTPVLFIKRIIKIRPEYHLYLLIYVLYIISWALSLNIVIFYRIQYAFAFSLIWIFLIIYTNKPIDFSRTYTALFILFLLLDFNKIILTSHTSYLVTCNSGRYAPYVTIFNKEDSQRGAFVNEVLCYE